MPMSKILVQGCYGTEKIGSLTMQVIIIESFLKINKICVDVTGLRLLVCGIKYEKELKAAGKYSLFEDKDRKYKETSLPYLIPNLLHF